MHPTIEKLIAAGPVVTDGAWGTQLQARGLAIGEFPDAWNLTHPERVGEVARAYVDAGSRVILTNTFGANRIRLGGKFARRSRGGNQPAGRRDFPSGRGGQGGGFCLDRSERKTAA